MSDTIFLEHPWSRRSE